VIRYVTEPPPGIPAVPDAGAIPVRYSAGRAMTIWTWDTAGVSGIGQASAEAHLRRQLPGARVVLREVRLSVGADLEGVYEPTGAELVGVREEDGTISWP
jgi:hypothetical protein